MWEQDDIFNKPYVRPSMKTLESFSYWTEVEKAGCGSIRRYAHRTIHNSICHGNKGNRKWLKFNVLPITQPGRGTRRASGLSKRIRELPRFYQIRRRRKASAEGNLLDRKQTSLLPCSSSQGGDGMKGSGEVWWERGSSQVSVELWPFSAFKSGTPQSD